MDVMSELSVVKTVYKYERNTLITKKEIMRIVKDNGEYYVYKKNYNDNEHVMLSFVKRASDTYNLKRFIINEIENVDYYSKFLLYKQGDLFSYISSTIIPRTTIDGIMCQLLSAVDYIHNIGILHRDIKAENILIQDNGDILLCDFEFAILCGNKPFTSNIICGTIEYISPDIIISGHYSELSDMYACMVVFFEMLSKNVPYVLDRNNKYTVKCIINEFHEYLLKRDFLHESINDQFEHDDITSLVELFTNTLTYKDKYNISDIKKHHYFNECDWDTLKGTIQQREINNEIGYIIEYVQSQGC